MESHAARQTAALPAEARPSPSGERRHRAGPLPIRWGDELGAEAGDAHLAWLWQGYLAPGLVTLLTSQWKIGKSTLTAALLAKLRGGGTLAGLNVAPGRAIVVSEENAAIWNERKALLPLEGQVGFLFRPFKGKPSHAQWRRLLHRLADLHAAQPFQLLVIDPIASFLPGADENHAAGMLQKLLPLQRLTKLGVAVLLLHHPAKAAKADGSLARGSGALPAFADIIVEMHWVNGPRAGDRRRRLAAFSRFPATPGNLIIELDAAGADYASLGPPEELAFATTWRKLEELFEDAEGKLTRRAVASRWATTQGKIDPTTLWRWLERAVAEGKLKREGAGHSDAPFRYWLEELEAEWEADPDYRDLLPEYVHPAQAMQAQLRAHRRARKAAGAPK